jgi:hypothetical protein
MRGFYIWMAFWIGMCGFLVVSVLVSIITGPTLSVPELVFLMAFMIGFASIPVFIWRRDWPDAKRIAEAERQAAIDFPGMSPGDQRRMATFTWSAEAKKKAAPLLAAEMKRRELSVYMKPEPPDVSQVSPN